jgi:AcrR family transcriptional regulator
MSHKYAHLRRKAVELRTQQQMTLDEIVARLQLPKTTVYYWIKDIPIERTVRQSIGQQLGTKAMQAKFAALRRQAYEQGVAEAPTLMLDPSFRDFVVLYMAEGYKRRRNEVAFVNSDPKLVMIAHRWIMRFAQRPLRYELQYHADHGVEELQHFWSALLNIEPGMIKPSRKSNSSQLSKRQFRSVHGLLAVKVGDTYFRARLEAWMDFIKAQW